MHDPIACNSFSLLQSQSYLEEEASVFLQNNCTNLQNFYMAPHPREVYSHCSLLWYGQVKIYLFLMKPHIMKMCGEGEIEFHALVTLAVDEAEWSTSSSGSFTPLVNRKGG
jgi:hypothetical protein